MRDTLKTILLLMLILLTQFVLRAPFQTEPFSRYEGAHAYSAQRMLQGELLYKDVFSNEQPVTPYIYSMAFKLFGESVDSVRTMTTVASMLTTLLIFFCGLMLFGSSTGLIAAALFSFFSGAPLIQGTAAVPETFAILFLSSAILLYAIAQRKNSLYYILSGLFFALAYYTKQSSLIIFALFALAIIFQLKKSERIKDLFLMAIGSAMVCFPMMAYLSAAGSYSSYIAQTVQYNLDSIANPLNPLLIFKTLTLALNENYILWMLSTTALIFMFFKERSSALVILALAYLASFAAIMSAGYYLNHNYILLLPVMTLLSAYVLTSWGELKAPLLANIFIGVIVVSTIFAVFYIQYPVYTVYDGAQISEAKFGTSNFNTAISVADQLRGATDPKDLIYVCGSEPELLFYAGRKSASRLIFVDPIWARSPSKDIAKSEILKDISEKKPKFIVWTISPSSFLDMFYLTVTDYDKYSEAYGWKIYKRKEGK